MKSEMPPRFCSHCAHVLSETDRFCPGCGAAIERTSSQPAPVKGKSSRNQATGATMIVVGVLAIPFGYMIFHTGQHAIQMAALIGWEFISISEDEALIREMIGGIGIVGGIALVILGIVWIAKKE